MIVVATDAEYSLAKDRFPKEKILKTGVGGVNVIKVLIDVSKDTPILNFGYVGSRALPVGDEVWVKSCVLYHPNVAYSEEVFELDFPKGANYARCYTSGDFVVGTDIIEPAVFDMELAYILALGFTNVRSLKMVSDNLNIKQYEEETKK